MSEKILSPEQFDRADELMQLWLERELTDEDAFELLELTNQFPLLVDRMIDQLQISQMLNEIAAASTSGDFLPVVAADDNSFTSNGKGRLVLSSLKSRVSVLVVPLLVVGVLTALLLIPGQGDRFVSPAEQKQAAAVEKPTIPTQLADDSLLVSLTEPTSDAVAVISQGYSVETADGALSLEAGSVLSPCRIRLKSGLLRLDFFNGARVTMEGPCDFEVASMNRAVCHAGKLTAVVPPHARGFVIDTPHGAVLDLGTGFGISVQPDRADLHVFEGLVELPDFEHMRVAEGNGICLTASGLKGPFPANLGLFESLGKIDELHLKSVEEKKKAWEIFCAELNRSKDLLLRCDFDGVQEPLNRTLKNLAVHSPVGSGVIVGCRPVEGRWPGKQALAFQSISDRVRIDIPGKYNAITLTAWICVHDYPERHAGFVMSDGIRSGGIHWQMKYNGQLLLCYINDPTDMSTRAEVSTRAVLTPDQFGKWNHVAVTIDVTAGRVIHYFNGEAVREATVPLLVPVEIGRANLGNWSSIVPKLPIRNLNGLMGEVTIHRRVLAPEEIKSLYLADPSPLHGRDHLGQPKL